MLKKIFEELKIGEELLGNWEIGTPSTFYRGDGKLEELSKFDRSADNNFCNSKIIDLNEEEVEIIQLELLLNRMYEYKEILSNSRYVFLVDFIKTALEKIYKKDLKFVKVETTNIIYDKCKKEIEENYKKYFSC